VLSSSLKAAMVSTILFIPVIWPKLGADYLGTAIVIAATAIVEEPVAAIS
jgi:hypothetical protein